MKRVMINSGLGNQMFQYAFARGLDINDDDVICDIGLITDRRIHHGELLQNIFKNISVKNNEFFAMLTRFMYHLIYLKKSRIARKVFNMLSWDLIMDDDSMSSSRTKNQIILGYWQSPKYFSPSNYRYEFKEELLSERTRRVADIIVGGGRNTVSLHVRRGDYLNLQGIYGDICTVEYYNKAICYICSKIENPQLFVFSDDIKWVKSNIVFPDKMDVRYIDFNNGLDSWQDMYLMSKCDHNIIANSTFSWWGAWLNMNPHKIVLRPERFTNTGESPDIFPEEWTEISV